ncbi:hypothetical protein N7470_006391 [Penicillium chermesinum]|nr:hypothetical protein N7470_006391 [Penicillium chermesinum]
MGLSLKMTFDDVAKKSLGEAVKALLSPARKTANVIKRRYREHKERRTWKPTTPRYEFPLYPDFICFDDRPLPQPKGRVEETVNVTAQPIRQHILVDRWKTPSGFGLRPRFYVAFEDEAIPRLEAVAGDVDAESAHVQESSGPEGELDNDTASATSSDFRWSSESWSTITPRHESIRFSQLAISFEEIWEKFGMARGAESPEIGAQDISFEESSLISRVDRCTYMDDLLRESTGNTSTDSMSTLLRRNSPP